MPEIKEYYETNYEKDMANLKKQQNEIYESFQGKLNSRNNFFGGYRTSKNDIEQQI